MNIIMGKDCYASLIIKYDHTKPQSLPITLKAVQVKSGKQTEKLSQSSRDWGDVTTKGNVETWIQGQKQVKKRERLVKSKEKPGVWFIDAPSQFLSSDKSFLVM